jgi:hypothetical protein
MNCINISWDSERVILAEFASAWTWDDFHDAVQQIHTMIAAAPHQTDIIIWHRVPFPSGNPMAHLARTLKNQPPNTGRIVIITPPLSRPLDEFIRSVAGIVQHVYPTKNRVISTTTIEQARALLSDIPHT